MSGCPAREGEICAVSSPKEECSQDRRLFGCLAYYHTGQYRLDNIERGYAYQSWRRVSVDARGLATWSSAEDCLAICGPPGAGHHRGCTNFREVS